MWINGGGTMDYKKISSEILTALGGKDNLKSYENCMTRLRVYPVDRSKVDFDRLKKITGVLGVVDAEQIQVILGPGHVQTVKEYIDQAVTVVQTVESPAKDVVANEMSRLEQVKAFFQKIGGIFVPIMPYFLLYGVVATALTYYTNYTTTTDILYRLLYQVQELAVYLLIGLIGYQSAKAFGANPIYNAFVAIGLLAITQVSMTMQVFNQPLLQYLRHGIILTTLCAAMIIGKVETFWKRMLPNLIRFYLLPVLTVLTTMLIIVPIFFPLMSALMTGILWLLTQALTNLGAISGFILSLVFLPTILLGVHQVLYPLHIQLLLEHGGNFLFPILATAGAGQLGSALALYLLEKNKVEKTKIAKCFPASILGMNEQLIFGITYPRYYPFIMGCLGGAFGGGYLGYLFGQGNILASATFGPSGFLLFPFILNYQWLNYLLALLISYIGGFVLTLCFGRRTKKAM